MPTESFPFPMYSGLLEPEHYKKIGTAIWLFLWCVSSTTVEHKEEEAIWGDVYGKKPVKLDTLAEQFGVTRKTISRWVDDLEKYDYIRVTRAPYGLIFSVKNSKKYLKRRDKNVLSETREETKMSTLIDGDETNLSNRRDIIVPSNKDITKIFITTPTPWEMEFSEEKDVDQTTSGMIGILNAYTKLHGKLDFHVKPREREAMGKMVAGGMPNPFTIRTMELLLEEKRKREGIGFKLPTSFLYYVEAIEEAWLNSQTSEASTVGVSQGERKTPQRLNKQQRELDDLRRRMEEEKRREQTGSIVIAN